MKNFLLWIPFVLLVNRVNSDEIKWSDLPSLPNFSIKSDKTPLIRSYPRLWGIELVIDGEEVEKKCDYFKTVSGRLFLQYPKRSAQTALLHEKCPQIPIPIISKEIPSSNLISLKDLLNSLSVKKKISLAEITKYSEIFKENSNPLIKSFSTMVLAKLAGNIPLLETTVEEILKSDLVLSYSKGATNFFSVEGSERIIHDVMDLVVPEIKDKFLRNLFFIQLKYYYDDPLIDEMNSRYGTSFSSTDYRRALRSNYYIYEHFFPLLLIEKRVASNERYLSLFRQVIDRANAEAISRLVVPLCKIVPSSLNDFLPIITKRLKSNSILEDGVITLDGWQLLKSPYCKKVVGDLKMIPTKPQVELERELFDHLLQNPESRYYAILMLVSMGRVEESLLTLLGNNR